MVGHAASPKAASVLSVIHDLGVLDKTVKKIEWFPSYKESSEGLAGMVI